MKTSESIKEIGAALAKAQGAMMGAKKDTANPFFKSRYADLASVWEACRDALSSNGIAVVQMTERSDKDEIIVETRLVHASGEWMEGCLSMPVSKADAQGYGSALTYARRYGLSAAVGVAPEDDDGNLAAQARPPKDAIDRIQNGARNGAHTATQVAKDALESMPAEEQTFIREYAMTVIGMFEEGKDVVAYLDANTLDNEEKLALWSLLPSNVRAGIKKAQNGRLASQP